jgi:hypothetical protein
MTGGAHGGEDGSHAHHGGGPPPAPPAPFFDTRCVWGLFLLCRNYRLGPNGEKVYVNNWYLCGACLGGSGRAVRTRRDREG